MFYTHKMAITTVGKRMGDPTEGPTPTGDLITHIYFSHIMSHPLAGERIWCAWVGILVSTLN
jgi:hypothetical protein